MQKVLVPLADGFEEIEAITIIDILRRAGADVVVAGLERDLVEGSHGLSVRADALLSKLSADDFDMIALPGGMPGAEGLMRSKKLLETIRRLSDSGKFTAAVCAAPVVLQEAGVTAGRTVTSHPSHAKFMARAYHTGNRVEMDDKVITGQAAGSAMEFAFKLVEVLYGKEKVKEVNETVLARIEDAGS
ncbi:MAG: DJ-1 family glyoxalase III [Fidelibacterota bacterium]